MPPVAAEPAAAPPKPSSASETAAMPETAASEQPRLWRMPIERYHQMIDAGVLGTDDRLELIDGLLVEKMPKSPLHSHLKRLLQHLLTEQCGAAAFVLSEDPITLAGSNSEPEPDLAVVRGALADYATSHPTGADVALVVEIAGTSLAKDHALAAIYAAGGVASYLIVDAAAKTLRLHTEPSPDGYGRIEMVETLPVTVDGQTVATIERASLFSSPSEPSDRGDG